MKTDIVIAGGGCAGLFCALSLPENKQIIVLTKADEESSDSFLAQGGMCMLADESDYEAYFADTLRAGHFENDKGSVEIMIKSSPHIVERLLAYGVEFEREIDGSLAFTREGAHSAKRIVYHKDITGREITSKLLAEVKRRKNIEIYQNTVMLDLIVDEENNETHGFIIKRPDGEIDSIEADYTVLATGGIGGLFEHSTNFKILTGDGVGVCALHGVELKDMSYIQIHPTTLFSERKEDRSFLISESVRGEGAKLLDKNYRRFVNELLPRDILTQRIYAQMKADETKHVWEDLRAIKEKELKSHFPNIIAECSSRGLDVFAEPIPVVPAQHYFMGGIKVDYNSKTSMARLYAIGETACNGVHGANRLASNSLLESLVFAERAAMEIDENYEKAEPFEITIDETEYGERYTKKLRQLVHEEIEKDKWAKVDKAMISSGKSIQPETEQIYKKENKNV